MMVDMMVPKRGRWISLKEKIWALMLAEKKTLNKFLCDTFGCTGPIIGTCRPIVIGKENAPPIHLNSIYWKRRCLRFGCGDIFSKHHDLISVDANLNFARQLDLVARTVNDPSIPQKEISATSL